MTNVPLLHQELKCALFSRWPLYQRRTTFRGDFARDIPLFKWPEEKRRISFALFHIANNLSVWLAVEGTTQKALASSPHIKMTRVNENDEVKVGEVETSFLKRKDRGGAATRFEFQTVFTIRRPFDGRSKTKASKSRTDGARSTTGRHSAF